MTTNNTSTSRNPDQPAVCPQCQMQLTKGSLNEHFITAHGRREPTRALQPKPSRSVAKAQRVKKMREEHAQPATDLQENISDTVIDVDSLPSDEIIAPATTIDNSPLAELIKKELSEGFVRCPDCTKKVKRELLAQHYKDKHKKSQAAKGKYFKGSKPRKAKKDPETDQPV